MKAESRFEQHYALNRSNKLIHINDAYEVDEEFFCPHCGCRMIKKCGKERNWHYAHDYRYQLNNNIACTNESYLHSYAKLRIKQWFEDSQEINIHYGIVKKCSLQSDCIWKNDKCQIKVNEKFNLKKSLKECKVEETVRVGRDYFRPDLLWRRPNKDSDRIFVEIKVTHKCAPAKIESGVRIIEFEVHSEEDVNRIVSNDIRECETIHFYGFNKEKEINAQEFVKEFNNSSELVKFIQYKNGSIYISQDCTCQNYLMRKPSSKLEITICQNDNKIDYFKVTKGLYYKLCAAFSNNIYGNPNCYLCNYSKYDNNGRLFCNLSTAKYIENKTEALWCKDFSLDTAVRDKLVKQFKFFIDKNPIDIWAEGKTLIHE